MKTAVGAWERILILFVTVLFTVGSGWSAEKNAPATIQPGRYFIVLGGCNDCHTPGWNQSNGTLSEDGWLTGDSVGWRGPWGTTYPTNLRILIGSMTEDAWVRYARLVRSNPPMPFWALNILREADSRAIYQYIRGLGAKGKTAPRRLPPDREPETPFLLLVPQNPKLR